MPCRIRSPALARPAWPAARHGANSDVYEARSAVQGAPASSPTDRRADQIRPTGAARHGAVSGAVAAGGSALPAARPAASSTRLLARWLLEIDCGGGGGGV